MTLSAGFPCTTSAVRISGRPARLPLSRPHARKCGASLKVSRRPDQSVMTPSVRMAGLSWQDYARRIAEEQPVLFLPVGAIEQHGQHLPMDCDVVIPDALAVRAAERIGGLVAPPIVYGYKSQPRIGGGNHFPGTTSLDGETVIRLARDLIRE